MASKVRFSKQVQSGDAARMRELMPHRLADNSEAEIRNDLFANAAKRFNIAKAFRRTTLRVHQPLGANIHDDCLKPSLELAADTTERFRLWRRTVTGYRVRLRRASLGSVVWEALVHCKHSNPSFEESFGAGIPPDHASRRIYTNKLILQRLVLFKKRCAFRGMVVARSNYLAMRAQSRALGDQQEVNRDKTSQGGTS